MSIDDARARKAIKTEALNSLADGEVTLQSVLERVPDALGTTLLWAVLLHTPKLGAKGAKRLCMDAGRIWPLTPMKFLTEHEREELIRCLPDRVRVA